MIFKDGYIESNSLFGKISGFITSIFYIFFIMNNSIREFFKIQPIELFVFYPRMGIGIAGYIIGWFHAKMGGVLMIASGLLMASFLINKGGDDMLPLIILFLISYFMPGVFILISDFKKSVNKT